MIKTVFICLALLCSSGALWSQCIVINEILINGPGPNDGQNSPDTEEWIELYNTCNTPIDIGCFVLTDGDYGVTIPSGTLLGPGDYYTIGSANAGFAVDLNVATCGCAGGTNVGVLTNGDEQMLLFDDNGAMQDGVIWGSGQMPVNFYQVAYTGCIGQNNSLVNASLLENLPSGGAQGCVLHRACDGNDEWLEDCDNSTPGSSNGGAPDYEIAWPQPTICLGDCVDWSLVDDNGVQSLVWTMEGALTITSADLAPMACYDEAGIFEISVSITSGCGPQTLTFPGAIEVQALNVNIVNTTPLPVCPGISNTLVASGTGTYQWYLDNQPIPNSNTNTLSVSEDGSYAVELTSGGCSVLSNSLDVDFTSPPLLSITPNGPLVLCPNQSVTLASSSNATNVQWFEDNTLLSASSSYSTDAAGLYYYTSTSNGCTFNSDTITILLETPFDLQLQASDTDPCPNTTVLIELNTTNASVDWMRNGIIFTSNNQTQITVDQSGNYSADIVTDNGCPYSSDTVAINYINMVAPIINSTDGENGICENSTITLSAQGAYTSFEWLMSGTLMGTGPTFTVNQPGFYSVIGILNDCSFASSDSEIVELPSPQLTLSSTGNITSCQTNYLMEIETDGELHWTFEGDPILLGNPALLTFEGAYTVYATHASGCTSTTQPFTLQFIDAPAINITASDSTPCLGENVQLIAEGPYQSWLWNDNVTSSVRSISQDGLFEIMGSSTNGCTNTATYEMEFAPLPSLNAPSIVESNCSSGALLTVETEGEVIWLNRLNALIGEGLEILVNPEQDEIYTALSEMDGCTSEHQILVTVDCDALYIPNTITPNGDGINDVFQIIGSGFSVYLLQIFDRWGNVVFLSADPSEVWTGGVDTYYVSDGIYHYRLEALNPQGLPIFGRTLHEGHVTVIR